MPAKDHLPEHDALVELCSQFNDVDEVTCLRFLRARKGSTKDAAAMLRKHLTWVSEYGPNAITQDSCVRAVQQGCWRAFGSQANTDDGESIGLLWVQLSLWRPSEYDAAEYTRMVVYFSERLPRLGPTHVVLFDMSGWKLSHGTHVRKLKALISTVQDHYPERLRAALLIRAPAIFELTWKMIKPWIDPVTAAKVHFLPGGAKEAAALAAFIEPSKLPNCYPGGQCAADAVPGLPDEPTVALQ
mmetsp:Transcript_1036/g.3337  ORF Transcript_1036/g.3337 Transcript_1036/m.3337 type:complete len:243 (+) Transcript_1036:55-783(+)